MKPFVGVALLAAICLNICFGYELPEDYPEIESPLMIDAGLSQPENSTNLNAANAKLMELKELNYKFTHTIIREFSRVKLSLDYIEEFGNAIATLSLNEEELGALNAFYIYETSVYGRFNSLRDKMNVFDRQVEYVPYRNLPATQLDNLNFLIDETLSSIGSRMGALHELIARPEHERMMDALSKKKENIQTQISEMTRLIALREMESDDRDDDNDEAVAKLKGIAAEIGKTGDELLQIIVAFRQSDESRKLNEIYDEIVNILSDFPTKIEFSFIKV